jgi:hypothetical protein
MTMPQSAMDGLRYRRRHVHAATPTSSGSSEAADLLLGNLPDTPATSTSSALDLAGWMRASTPLPVDGSRFGPNGPPTQAKSPWRSSLAHESLERRGKPHAHLHAIHVPHDSVKPNTRYRVDVKAKRLVEEQPADKPAQ